jgi:hypothetical protein
MKTTYIWWVGAAAVLVVVAGVIVKTQGSESSSKTSETQTNQNQDNNLEQTNEDQVNYITIEAGDGTLEAPGNSGSYIGESARGLEAYLASDGDKAAYKVDITNPGRYMLDVKLSDDGTWNNGDRSVTISINNSSTLKYDHQSENTNGWKWYTLGGVTLNKGANTIVFTKNPNGYAAYVMDEFRLKPNSVDSE